MRQFLFILFLLASLPAAPLGAAPIQYRVSMTVPTLETHPFSGATLTLNVKWDHASLSPIESRIKDERYAATSWPVTNTEGTVTIGGGTQFDGVFPLSFINGTTVAGNWDVGRNSNSTHDVYFPTMRFESAGLLTEIRNLIIAYASAPLETSLPVYPESFAAEIITRARGQILSPSGSFPLIGNSLVSGNAVVPEPTALCLCISGTAIALHRQRRHRRA